MSVAPLLKSPALNTGAPHSHHDFAIIAQNCQMSQNPGPPSLPWISGPKGSGYIGSVGCRAVPLRNLWGVGDIPQGGVRSHHIQPYSLYETYGTTSKDYGYKRAENPIPDTLECWEDGHSRGVQGGWGGPAGEQEAQLLSAGSGCLFPGAAQAENMTEDCGLDGQARAEGPWVPSAASPSLTMSHLHIPGGALPLFQRQQPAVQVSK